MRLEHMADFLEEMNNSLPALHLGWLIDIDGPKAIYKSKQIQDAVKDFVLYCIEENLKALHVPRGWKQRKSYLDYRREAMERAGEVVNETETADSAC